MRLAEEEMSGLGFDIWFISIDKPELLYASPDQPDVAYSILSDASLEATCAFGLAFRVDKVRLHPDVLLSAARSYKNEANLRIISRQKAEMEAQ